MGRLTRDPEVRYSQSDTPIAIAKYALAVNRKFRREGEPEADFINCVALGKQGEFAEKYLKKGMLVCVVGRLQIRSYEDQYGQKRWITEVIIEEQNFAESKSSFEARKNSNNNLDSDLNSEDNSSDDNNMSALLNNLDDMDSPF